MVMLRRSRSRAVRFAPNVSVWCWCASSLLQMQAEGYSDGYGAFCLLKFGTLCSLHCHCSSNRWPISLSAVCLLLACDRCQGIQTRSLFTPQHQGRSFFIRNITASKSNQQWIEGESASKNNFCALFHLFVFARLRFNWTQTHSCLPRNSYRYCYIWLYCPCLWRCRYNCRLICYV